MKTKKSEVEKHLEEINPKAKKLWYLNKGLDFLGMGIDKLVSIMPNVAQNSFMVGNYIIGCSALALYISRDAMSRGIGFKNDVVRTKVDQLNNLDSEEKAIDIMQTTRDKAVKTVENESGYKVDKKMDPSEVVFSSGQYISEAKRRRDTYVKAGMSFATTGALVASSVVLGLANTANVPAFLGIMGATLGSSVYASYKQTKNEEKYRKAFLGAYARKEVAKKDIYDVRATNDKHQEFMVDKYREASQDEHKSLLKKVKHNGRVDITSEIVNTLGVVGLLGASLYGKPLDINTLMSIYTLASLYKGVINSTQKIVYDVANLKGAKDRFSIAKDRMKDILPTYTREKSKEKDFDKDEIKNIQIKDFVYEYCGEKGEKDRFVKVPNLELNAGETLLITGRSGSGKSTFIKALMGMNTPEIEGEPITINGNKRVNKLHNVIFNDDVKDMMGNNTLLEELTFSSDSKEVDYAKLEKVLDGVGMLDYLTAKFPDRDLKAVLESAYYSTFSGGESAKLKIARMLYQLNDKTDVICMDEPTGRLDPRSAVKVMKFVKEFANEDKKRAMILVSHDLNLMQSDVYDKWQYIDDNFTFQQIESEEDKEKLLKVYTKDESKGDKGKLIDEIRGMSLVDFVKFQQEQATSEIRKTVGNRGHGGSIGNSIHNLDAQPGGEDR